MKTEIAYFGGGCFWCTEAIFSRLKGVSLVTSGYAGGKMENPNYDAVSSGTTGHAEVVRVEFDPDIISYDTLLDVFWETHDPTSLNQQGADIGTQYRSIILTTNNKQLETARKKMPKKAVTEIKKLDKFYDAESYHKNYYEHNHDQPYCQLVISPKIKKLFQAFPKLIK